MTETNRTCHPAGRRAGCRAVGRREPLTYPTPFLKPLTGALSTCHNIPFLAVGLK